MRNSFAALLFVCALVSAPAFAGDLTGNNGLMTWHSTQCTKPNAPPSLLGADRETSGDSMNDLIAQHNAYVDAAQGYMTCVSSEAERDQVSTSQEITSGAQKAIADEQAEIDKDAQALRSR